jgi:hypothetical protein
MRRILPSNRTIVTWAAALVVLKVTLSVVSEYRRYLPPDFEADFLMGRETYFWGGYCWAFYTHLVAGPVSLLWGTILISDRFRAWAPRWHRWLGRWQVACILLLLTPSGLWMARYAATGMVAGAGLAVLAIATATCTTLGWRAAVQRRFDVHRRWMSRAYLLMLSAVLIRLIGGLATVLQIDSLWLYPLSVWISWLLPLAAFEAIRLRTDFARACAATGVR